MPLETEVGFFVSASSQFPPKATGHRLAVSGGRLLECGSRAIPSDPKRYRAIERYRAIPRAIQSEHRAIPSDTERAPSDPELRAIRRSRDEFRREGLVEGFTSTTQRTTRVRRRTMSDMNIASMIERRKINDFQIRVPLLPDELNAKAFVQDAPPLDLTFPIDGKPSGPETFQNCATVSTLPFLNNPAGLRALWHLGQMKVDAKFHSLVFTNTREEAEGLKTQYAALSRRRYWWYVEVIHEGYGQ